MVAVAVGVAVGVVVGVAVGVAVAVGVVVGVGVAVAVGIGVAVGVGVGVAVGVGVVMTTAAPLLADECEEFRSKLENTQYWYSVRLEHLRHWAHSKLSAELRTEYFSIVANGHEAGSPPTYAQKMNMLSHARDKAEAECSRLQERVRVLEEALRPFAEIRAAGATGGEWIRIDHAEPYMRLTNWCDAARAALEGIEVE